MIKQRISESLGYSALSRIIDHRIDDPDVVVVLGVGEPRNADVRRVQIDAVGRRAGAAIVERETRMLVEKAVVSRTESLLVVPTGSAPTASATPGWVVEKRLKINRSGAIPIKQRIRVAGDGESREVYCHGRARRQGRSAGWETRWNIGSAMLPSAKKPGSSYP